MSLLRSVDTAFLLIAVIILWNLFQNGAAALSTKKSADQLAKRRKSPALWREDLQQHPPDHHDIVITTSSSSSTTESVKRLLYNPPEVMAPAGGWPQLQAAVRNGADAVYLGLSSFSARARAANFAPDELPKAVAFCHAAAVKVYVAINTLVFQQEWEEVIDLIKCCAAARVDAVIVQDIGLTRLIRQVAPDLEIHASTQQTVTSADGVAFAATVGGATRVVVGRELSVDEISQVSAEGTASDTEIEAFVHGALCVSYSGQCFSSEAWGGRSANRGQCAQACRLPYGLIVNGELRDLQDMSYLLSPQDLCGLDQVKELIKAGVSCLKIEGRLKDAAYVAATTRAYRNAVDQAWTELVEERYPYLAAASSKHSRNVLLDGNVTISKAELSQLFSRGQDEEYGGLTPGFFEGSKHQRLVRGRSPRHRGVHVGRVGEGSSWKKGLILSLDEGITLKRGDGLVVDRGLAQEEELGGPVFEVTERNDSHTVTVRFGREVERSWRKSDDDARKGLGNGLPMAPRGAHVWRTSDADVEKKMQRLIDAPLPRQLVQVRIAGSVGEKLQVLVSDGKFTGAGISEGPLEQAQTAGLNSDKVRKAVGTLGNTPWAIDGDLDVTALDEDAWCPVSWIKDARRQAVEDLKRHYNAASKADEGDEILSNVLDDEGDVQGIISDALDKMIPPMDDDSSRTESEPTTLITVLARNYEQVDCLCCLVENGEVELDEIMVDFLEVEGMRDAVDRVRQTGTVRVILASPRILKPGESGIWRTLLRLEPDGLLVRSPGLLYRMNQLGGTGARINVGTEKEEKLVTVPPLIGDFSLNAANLLTAYEFLNQGVERITASYDLSANAITSLAGAMTPKMAQRLEVVVHAKLPIFHTEHCVFARFLSKGNSYLDCGHVCTRNNVHLRDEMGSDNLVLADMGCRNTVFAAQAQSGVYTIGDWKRAGVGRLRIELVDEGPVDIPTIVRGYLGVLSGEVKPSTVWESLQHVRDSNGRASGVTFGSLRNHVERRAGEL